MPRPISHQVHLLHEGRRYAVRGGNAAAEHSLHDHEIPETRYGLADERRNGCVGHEPAGERRTPGAASLIVIGVDGDNPCDAGVMPRGEEERERAADRDASEGDVAEVKLVEK